MSCAFNFIIIILTLYFITISNSKPQNPLGHRHQEPTELFDIVIVNVNNDDSEIINFNNININNNSTKKKIVNTEQVYEFLDSLNNLENRVRGYRYMFNEIKKNPELYSATMLSLVRRVKYLYLTQPITRNSRAYIDLREIYNQFTIGLQNFIFDNTTLKITNAISGNFLSFKNNAVGISDYVATQISDRTWNIDFINNYRYFQLSTYDRNYFLYAPLNQQIVSLTDDRTLVSSMWIFEPILKSSSFRIKNVLTREYLFADISESLTNNTDDDVVLLTSNGVCPFSVCRWSLYFD